MHAYLTLVKADFDLALRGVPQVIAALNPATQRPVCPEDLAVIGNVVQRVKRAALSYRPGARCLPQAVAAARLLRARGYPVKLVVAVRRFPFAAHAWVECDGAVLTDWQGVKDEFTPILVNEPSATPVEVTA